MAPIRRSILSAYRFNWKWSRMLVLAAAMAAGSSVISSPQKTVGLETFEVATIKPSVSRGIIGGSCHGVDSKYSIAMAASAPALGRCFYSRTSLKALVLFAYRESADQGLTITGREGWTGTDVYDVEGKAEDPSSATQEQLRRMLQSLLRDRFKLQFHRETRVEQGFAIFRIGDGPNLKVTVGDEPKPGSLNEPQKGSLGIIPDGAGRILKARSMTVAAIVRALAGKPIMDKTGLTGLYDVSLSWTPDALDPVGLGDGSGDRSGPSWVTALREQLGIRVESQKVPVEVLVIDNAEKPTLN
jgi:uncharacterized protein (TIGR03435 family)